MSHYFFKSMIYENFGKLKIILILMLSQSHQAIKFYFQMYLNHCRKMNEG